MNKIMKSLIAISLSTSALFTSSIWGQENSTEKILLTVEKAQNIMLENSLELKANQLNIEDLEIDLEDAREQAEKRKNVPGLNVQNYVIYRREEKIDPVNAQMNYDVALRQYVQEEETEKLKVLQDYYQLFEQKLKKENAEKSYEIQRDEYDKLVKQEKLGQVSSFDVKQKAIEIQKAKINVDNLKDEYERKEKELFDILMIENPEEYVIDFEGLHEVKYPLPSLEDTLVKIDDTLSVYQSIIAEQLAETVLDYTDDYYKEGTGTYTEAKRDLSIATMNLRDARLQQEYQIRSSYSSLVNLQEQLILSRYDLELLQKKLDIAKTQYDLGVNVEIGVRKAQENLDAAELSYQSLVHQYETAKAKFIIKYELYKM